MVVDVPLRLRDDAPFLLDVWRRDPSPLGVSSRPAPMKLRGPSGALQRSQQARVLARAKRQQRQDAAHFRQPGVARETTAEALRPTSPKVNSTADLAGTYQGSPGGLRGPGRRPESRSSGSRGKPKTASRPRTPTTPVPFRLRTEERIPLPVPQRRQQRSPAESALAAEKRRPCIEGPARCVFRCPWPEGTEASAAEAELALALDIPRNFVSAEIVPGQSLDGDSGPDHTTHVTFEGPSGCRTVERFRAVLANSGDRARGDSVLKSPLSETTIASGPLPMPSARHTWIIEDFLTLAASVAPGEALVSPRFSIEGVSGLSFSMYPKGLPKVLNVSELSAVNADRRLDLGLFLHRVTGSTLLPFRFYLALGAAWRGPLCHVDRPGYWDSGVSSFFRGGQGVEQHVGARGELAVSLEIACLATPLLGRGVAARLVAESVQVVESCMIMASADDGDREALRCLTLEPDTESVKAASDVLSSGDATSQADVEMLAGEAVATLQFGLSVLAPSVGGGDCGAVVGSLSLCAGGQEGMYG